MDLDNTTWYKDEWTNLFPECPGFDIPAWRWLLEFRIKKNASAQVPPEYYDGHVLVVLHTPAYALEGYGPTDPPAGCRTCSTRQYPSTCLGSPSISRRRGGFPTTSNTCGLPKSISSCHDTTWSGHSTSTG